MGAFELGAAIVILLVAAAYIGAVAKNKNTERSNEPLAIPKGSVRAILGLFIVGEFVNFLIFGSSAFQSNPDTYRTVLTVFATLASSVTGFYFGSRSSSTERTQPGSALVPAQDGAGQMGIEIGGPIEGDTKVLRPKTSSHKLAGDFDIGH
jgi:hypothetical protein